MSEGKNTTGKILEVKDGIVIAEGLENLAYNEIVEIQTKDSIVSGLALNLDENSVGIAVLGDYKIIREGDLIKTTGKQLSISVDPGILGKVINPLGISKDITDPVTLKNPENMPLEKVAPGVIDRKNVSRSLATGIKTIDAMFPIGKGQRELIIGDRQTGKTTVAIDTILNQKGKNVYCIYVAIGQKESKIAQIRSLFEKNGALSYTVIVSASASDPASLQYIAPFAGCAIGEYFAQKGKDALVIYDDLTKHAWAYRELSLLLRRPPGREAYPGDIFYLHSRLLERALQYSDTNKGGSLTALPIIETQAGDISAYIPTNIISITDGQIFLESDLFNAGQKPAVNIGLSVSRVGGDAQIKALKQVAGSLKLDLAQYRELATFAQFGSDLDKETQEKLDRGARITELLKQTQNNPIPIETQTLLIYLATNGYIDKTPISEIDQWEQETIKIIDKSCQKITERIAKGEKIEEELILEIKKIFKNT